MFGENEDLPSEDEFVTAREEAVRLLRVWKLRAIAATIALALSCCLVIPFLDGHRLHAYWEPAGKYLVILSMILLGPFVVCVGITFNSWLYLRGVVKDQAEFR